MIYLDTSVVLPLLVREPKTGDVKVWFTAMNDVAASSDWLIAEFASAISIKIRTGELAENDAKAVRREFTTLTESGLRILPVSRGAFRKAAELATQHKRGLRAEDALHLAVALEIGARSIATLDSVMAVTARRLKISVENI